MDPYGRNLTGFESVSEKIAALRQALQRHVGPQGSDAATEDRQTISVLRRWNPGNSKGKGCAYKSAGSSRSVSGDGQGRVASATPSSLSSFTKESFIRLGPAARPFFGGVATGAGLGGLYALWNAYRSARAIPPSSGISFGVVPGSQVRLGPGGAVEFQGQPNITPGYVSYLSQIHNAYSRLQQANKDWNLSTLLQHVRPEFVRYVVTRDQHGNPVMQPLVLERHWFPPIKRWKPLTPDLLAEYTQRPEWLTREGWERYSAAKKIRDQLSEELGSTLQNLGDFAAAGGYYDPYRNVVVDAWGNMYSPSSGMIAKQQAYVPATSQSPITARPMVDVTGRSLLPF